MRLLFSFGESGRLDLVSCGQLEHERLIGQHPLISTVGSRSQD